MTRWIQQAAITALGIAAWTLLVAYGALHGFWRPALTDTPQPRAFAEAARQALPQTFRGNLVLVLLKGGRPVASVAAGPPGALPDGASVFQVASLGKWVTAAGVLAMVDRGLIGLDDPVEDHLRRWRFPGSAFDSRQVTIRRLLSHTAGLTDGLGYNGFADAAEVQSLEASLRQARDAMDGISGRVEIGQRPGQRFAYSGGGYTVLQMMIEDVTGQPFGPAMDDLLFHPLGMTATSFDFGEIADVLAPIFDARGQRAAHRFYTARAAASLYTSADDLATFLAAVWTPSDDGGLLSAGMQAAMASPDARILGVPVWGLGARLYLATRREAEVIGHDGRNQPAINTAARLHLATGDGIIVLATGTADLASVLADDWVYWRTGRVSITFWERGDRRLVLVWLLGIAGLGAAAVAVRASRRSPSRRP